MYFSISFNQPVVVMYTGEFEAVELFKAALSLASESKNGGIKQKIKDLIWIGSDAWSSKMSIAADNKR